MLKPPSPVRPTTRHFSAASWAPMLPGARGPAVAERGGKVRQREPCVGGERDIGAGGAADLLGEDVDVDQRLALRDQLESFGRDLAKLAADHDQGVGGGNELIGDAG